MTQLVVQIRFAQEQEEWLASYPGDPLVRPASYIYDIRYSDGDLMQEWLDLSTPDCDFFHGNIHHPTGIETWLRTSYANVEQIFPNGWYDGQIRFTNKCHMMLFKLAFA